MRARVVALLCCALASSGAACSTPPMVDAGADAATRPDASDPSDASVPSDAGASPDGADAARVNDAAADAATEPCTTPFAVETVPCGRCGFWQRVCTPDGVWAYEAECTEPFGAECVSGTTGTLPCLAYCGAVPVHCDELCHWVDDAACELTTECSPGAVEHDTTSCAATESRVRECSASCVWAPFGPCSDAPSDLDGDGVPYALDCDDGDPAVVPGSSRACGTFACVGSPFATTGSQTCVGPGWSLCARAPGCDELPAATCGSTATWETRDCASIGCDLGWFATESRMCVDGAWTPWSGCDPPAARPGTCAPNVARPCGACGEGVYVTGCDEACRPLELGCFGAGCVPGTVQRSTSGCAPGEFRAATCDASCELGAPGACRAYPAAVDVLLLLDNSRSIAARIGGAATVLRSQLIDPLLADPDVRIGVATFSDFPRGPYGDAASSDAADTPYRQLLQPSGDAAAVLAAVRALGTAPGGDDEEGLVEALNVAAGGTPHPDSIPPVCPTGLALGGCWRPDAQRVVVVVTDAIQHNIPHPALDGAVVAPYERFLPAPPTWPAVRERLVAAGISVFSIAQTSPGETALEGAAGQMRLIASELGQDPSTAVATFDRLAPDFGPPARALVSALRAHLGLASP